MTHERSGRRGDEKCLSFSRKFEPVRAVDTSFKRTKMCPALLYKVLRLPYFHPEKRAGYAQTDDDGKAIQTVLTLLENLELRNMQGRKQFTCFWRTILGDGAVEVVCKPDQKSPIQFAFDDANPQRVKGLRMRVFQNDWDWAFSDGYEFINYSAAVAFELLTFREEERIDWALRKYLLPSELRHHFYVAFLAIMNGQSSRQVLDFGQKALIETVETLLEPSILSRSLHHLVNFRFDSSKWTQY